MNAGEELLAFSRGRRYGTILADPPWQFQNKTGKVAPGHKHFNDYRTLSLEDIASLPVTEISAARAHLYLWCPNALLPNGLAVMSSSGFRLRAQPSLAQGAKRRRV